MRCETTSSVKECALRARSGDVHVARVVPLVVDAVVGLTLGLVAHVIVVVFVVAILHRIFCFWRYTLYTNSNIHLVRRTSARASATTTPEPKPQRDGTRSKEQQPRIQDRNRGIQSTGGWDACRSSDRRKIVQSERVWHPL